MPANEPATLFLLSAAVTIFLIGLVSEQITQLMYKDCATSAPETRLYEENRG